MQSKPEKVGYLEDKSAQWKFDDSIFKCSKCPRICTEKDPNQNAIDLP